MILRSVVSSKLYKCTNNCLSVLRPGEKYKVNKIDLENNKIYVVEEYTGNIVDLTVNEFYDNFEVV